MILRINTRTPAVHVFVLFFCSIKKRSRSKTIQLDPLAEHIYPCPLRSGGHHHRYLCLLGPTVETRNQKQARDRSKMEEPQQAPNNKANKSSSRFRRVCVFCGSSPGKKAAYQLAAVQLGHHLVDRGIDLVYGGGSVGLMGLVSRAVHNGGGHVLGIVPKAVLPLELIGDTPGELKDVPGMHQRKAEMARHSDAFIALPGGYGTLEELLEVITWAQLGIHSKPVGLLNVDGYYDSLLSFVDRAVQEGFVTSAARSILVAAAAPHDLLAKLEDYVPVHDDATPNLTWEFSR